MKRCDRQRRSRFQARETPPQRPTDRRLRANLRAFATTSRLASAHEGRIAVISMKSQTKEKAGGKKGKSRSKSRGTSRSLSPGSRNQVCKFWKAGKCQRGNECAFQHPPKPAAPSTKDDKRGKSQNKKKKNKKKNKNKKKGDRSRSSSRGSNSSRGSQSLKDKGGKPSSSGSAAVCLMRALMMVAVINPSTSTHRVPEGIASPQFLNQHFAMPVTPNPIALFHVGATLKSSKFPLSMIAI